MRIPKWLGIALITVIILMAAYIGVYTHSIRHNHLPYARFVGDVATLDFNSLLMWGSNGDAHAEDELGKRYLQGVHGVAANPVTAAYWFQQSAQQGNSDAEYYLGWIYENGLGVARDNAEAFSWYQKSAMAGNADGETFLGSMYGNGFGVNHDYSQAYYWYQKSADQGNAGGEINLGVLYFYGHGVRKNWSQARFWLQKALDNGMMNANVYLRQMDHPELLYPAGLPAPPTPAPAAPPTPAAPPPASATTADTIVPGLSNCVTTYMRGDRVVVHNGCGQLVTLGVRGSNGAYFQAPIGANEDVPALFFPSEDLKFFACPGRAWIQESSANILVTYNTQHYECKVLD